jgi:ABC-type multidrug transport system fused ATPase/permease subunit
MRIIDPIEGVVRIGNHDIKEITLEQLRALCTYVPQEPSLFSDTIGNNIIFGREYSDNELARAIALAQLSDFLKQQPKGLDELIGEKGLQLSGGEKQRIAICRAVLKRPKILVLDDATSNLDAETERELIDQLSAEPDTTLIIISHRLSILSVCDYIYTLDKGKVMEQGTHDTLLNTRGLYYRLYKYQVLEEALKQ